MRNICKFYRECLPRLNPGEVYFVSLSARNKYLTEEERKESDLRQDTDVCQDNHT